jgi:transposase
LEWRRRLAVGLADEGADPADVAGALSVTERSLRRWRAAERDRGAAGLGAVPHPGRPPKLSPAQAAEVIAWLGRPPTAFGFDTDRWTAPRVAQVVAREFGVAMNPRYLNRWLRRHGDLTPQRPQRRAAERDEAAVAAWRRRDWPRIKKTRGTPGRPWGSATRAASCCSRWSARRWPRAVTRPCSRTGPGTGTRSRPPRP